MKIVIAPDSFKGTNTAIKMCEIIENGVRRVFPDSEIIKIPVADGGEGTVDSILYAIGGTKEKINVTGPLGDSVEAFYGTDGDSAIIEMAAASGLPLVPDEKRNPELTTTYGTGEIIKTVLENGYTKILIGVGGSATNDGGLGMAKALGYRFLDKKGNIITKEGGGALNLITDIDDTQVLPQLKNAEITVACDVKNPLLGENGATAIYGPQKGATHTMVQTLEKNLTHFSEVIYKKYGKDFSQVQGSGAAGGLAFGLLAFCNAKIKSGIETILQFSELEKHLKNTDLVITGEGKIDGQSIMGKVPVGVAEAAKKYNLPVLVMAGDIGPDIEILYKYGVDSIMSSVNRAMPLKEALENSSSLMLEAVERAMRIIKIGMDIEKKRD